jgi:periplasmic protein TonB
MPIATAPSRADTGGPPGRPALGRFLLASLALHALVLALGGLEPPAPQPRAEPLQVALVQGPRERPAATHEPAAPDRRDAAPPLTSETLARASAPSPRGPEAPAEHAPLKERAPEPVARPAPRERQPGGATAATARAASTAPGPERRRDAGKARGALQASLSRVLAEHFYYPPLARRRGWEGEVELGLRIAPDGALTDIRVVRSSGFPALDGAAMDALKRAARLPDAVHWRDALPLDAVLPVHFRLVSG